MTEITVLTKAPPGAQVREITIEEVAKGLGISIGQAEALLEPVAKNLTVGDVHVSTALSNISTAYLQGEDDGEQEEEDDDEQRDRHEAEEARKANENHDEHGRFAEGSSTTDNHAGVQAHVGALHAAGVDRAAFEQAHAALASDKDMKLSDLKRVAGRYLGGHIHSSKDNRKDVLDNLGRMFTEHARFNNKLKRYSEALGVDEAVVEAVLKYSEDEPRDDHGMWSSGGSSASVGERGQTVFRQGFASGGGTGTVKRLSFNVAKMDADQQKVFGWASVSALDGKLVVDKQDDIILIADLEKAAHDFTLYSRTQGDMHTDIGVGRMIESVIIDQAKRDAGLVAKDAEGREIDGWWVGFRVDDDDVWAAHKRGDRLEFSIGGRAQREPVVEKAWSDEARAAAVEARARAAKNRELAEKHPEQAGLHGSAAASFDQAAHHFEQSTSGGGKASFKEGQRHMEEGKEHSGIARQLRGVHGIF